MWERVAPILAEHDPATHRGRKRIDPRAALDAIVYRLRSGVQWNHLPAEFPDDSSVHRTFQRWQRLAIFERIWALVQAECEARGGVDWEWQAADTAVAILRRYSLESRRSVQRSPVRTRSQVNLLAHPLFLLSRPFDP